MRPRSGAPRSRAGLAARLERSGHESERLHLRCWLGGGALRRRASRVKVDEANPWDCALRGRRLSLEGDFESAQTWLDRAGRGLPREARVRAWRGELALLRGDLAGAEKELDAAASLDARYPWTFVYRAALRFRQEDMEGSRRDLERTRALRPGSPAGYALKAVLEAHRGRSAEAGEWLSRALARGRQPWVYALRGTMRARWNELGGARRDMNRALRRERSPWLLLERAGVARKLGEFWTAFGDLEKASEALPHHAEPHLGAAAIHLEQAQYEQALDRLTRALALSPDDASIHQRRARVHFVCGRLREAQRDIEAASRLAPSDPDLRQERIQLLIVRGFDDEALEALKDDSVAPAVSAFWSGYLDCRRGRFGSARLRFERARASSEAGSSLAEKARFYGLVARTLQEGAGASPRGDQGRGLALIGLGYRHPFQVSLGAVRALAECDLIYSNLSDSRVTDFLGLFPAPFEVIVFRTLNQQAEESARTVMRGFSRARRVAVVTRGQPVVYGRLAYRLSEHCRARGIACRVPSSVSIFETLPSLVPESGGRLLGLQVRDASCLEGIDPRLPLVVYLPLSRGAAALGAVLSRSYPARHPCHLLPGAGINEFVARGFPLSALKGALRQGDPACTLYLPPRREK